MSESVIPSYVDTRKVFPSDGKLTGFIGLERMPRFQGSLVNDSAEIEIELEFSVNRSKQRLITGRLRAEVEVACQRCLEPVRIELVDDINLALLRRESDIDKLEESLDPWVVEDHRLDLALLAEEQLLLCLPIVSTHEDPNCLSSLGYKQLDADVSSAGKISKDTNPFAVLKTLKD